MAKKKNSNLIENAIKRPGALTKAVGKNPKTGKINQKKAEKATKAPGKLGEEARFYENVLKPANKKK